MVKEIVYQAVDYLGIGRVLPFLEATNEVLDRSGAYPCRWRARPRPPWKTGWKKAPRPRWPSLAPRCWRPGRAGHINRWLAANCFGDYYTRTGLTLAQREMITFCFLAAQGGCEPQLTSHAKGNMNLGNDKDVSHPGGLPVPALYRLSPEPECHRLHQQSRGGMMVWPAAGPVSPAPANGSLQNRE